jgi:hypothetical protein
MKFANGNLMLAGAGVLNQGETWTTGIGLFVRTHRTPMKLFKVPMLAGVGFLNQGETCTTGIGLFV